MPTYVYRREDGSTFEIEQRITEDPLKVDPETGQKVERVITGAGLIFKGSGFYLTDYARQKSANGNESGGSSSTEKAATTSTSDKSESKSSSSEKTESASKSSD